MADSTAYARIPARPTTYKGIKMRSRLEAAYAQGLDLRGVKWQYEPECFADETGQYLPDFLVDDIYIEIKPRGGNHDVASVLERMHIIHSSLPLVDLYVIEGYTTPAGGSGFEIAARCGRPPCSFKCLMARLEAGA